MSTYTFKHNQSNLQVKVKLSAINASAPANSLRTLMFMRNPNQSLGFATEVFAMELEAAIKKVSSESPAIDDLTCWAKRIYDYTLHDDVRVDIIQNQT